jgi:transketolase
LGVIKNKLPNDARVRVAIEAATSLGWQKYVGLDGAIIGIDHFGASAPAVTLYEKFGIATQRVVDEALRLLNKKGK